MTNETSINFAGEVKIDKAMVTSTVGFQQDIRGQIASISIFEDIFSPFISGHIIIKDSLDLMNLFPLTGQDYIDLDISTPSLEQGTIRQTFLLYKMTDREVLGDKSIVYKLHFVSIEALVNVNKKISKAYNDNIGDIVSLMLTDEYDGLETRKATYIEPVAKRHKYISNFWTPLENIHYLMNQAVNRDGAPYVFFENRDGFFFITLESMYDAETYQEFTTDKYTRDEVGQKKDVKNIGEDYKRITDMNVYTGYDFIARIKSGMYASRQISYDLYNKKYTVKDFTTADEFENLKSLNPYSGISRNQIARNNAAQMTYIKTSNIFTDFTDNNGDTSNAPEIQKRKALLAMSKLNCINITVPGRVDYSVGQKVKISLPKINPLQKEDDDYYDQRWSGYYIIAAINHNINKERHECRMELISDSLQMSADAESEE